MLSWVSRSFGWCFQRLGATRSSADPARLQHVSTKLAVAERVPPIQGAERALGETV